MMERKAPFIVGESYHIYTRGVEKRIVFEDENDRRRFMILLLVCNSRRVVHMANLLKKYQGLPLIRIFEKERPAETLTSILAYTLMPNHVHLIAREKTPGGISKFMSKLMTAYSMYFNTKNDRSGPLFTRPFRSKNIDTDEYFRWVFAYTTLNPLELFAVDWKTNGIADKRRAIEHLVNYRYSSFQDYFGESRAESVIIDRSAFDSVSNVPNIETMLDEFSKNTRHERNVPGNSVPALI